MYYREYRPIYPTFKQLTNIMQILGMERKATVKPWYWKDGDPEGRIHPVADSAGNHETVTSASIRS